MAPSTHPTATPPAAFQRQIHWRARPALAFLGILVGLGAVALVALLSRPPTLSGLPDDPDVRAAAELLRDGPTVETLGLRFESALLGGGGAEALSSGLRDDRLAKAEAHLARARARHPLDRRILGMAAGIDLLRRRYLAAEWGYRAALERGPRYPEARLGLGVTLASRAESAPDPLLRRSFQLEAIAQFAALKEGDLGYDAALYDRALLLDRVGRSDEARRIAAAYLARDPNSAWAERLRSELRMVTE